MIKHPIDIALSGRDCSQKPSSQYYVSCGDRAGGAGTYYFETFADALAFRDQVQSPNLCADVNGINAEGGYGDNGSRWWNGLTEEESEQL